MKVSSFKKFLEEEDSKAIVQTGLNSKSIDNSVTKEIINSRLANVTSNSFLTPYIALGSIARILAYVNIVVPQYTFLDREEGEVVFDATQVGQIAGVNLDGSPARTEADHFIYFSYSMNDDGYYDCFAALVDSDELERIMDMGGDADVDQFDVDQKVNEEQIDELSAKKYGNYIRKASIDIEDRAGTVADVKQQKSGFTQGGYYHTHLSNVEKNQQKKVDQRKRGITTATNKLVSKANEEAEHVDEAMKWDRFTAHSEPSMDQDTIKGHKEAAKWHAERAAEARREYDKNPNFKTRRNVEFYAKRASHHEGSAHDMRMQGMKEELKGDQHKLDVAEPKGKLTSADFKKLRGEESTNPAAQAAQELKNRIAAHKAAKPQSVRKPAAAPAPKSEPSVYDAAQKVKATSQNPAAQELKNRIAAHQQTKKK